MSLKNPNWNDNFDKKRYNELLNKKPEHLTDNQKEFLRDMRIAEEFICGLDGD